jgi:hypothetical protein
MTGPAETGWWALDDNEASSVVRATVGLDGEISNEMESSTISVSGLFGTALDFGFAECVDLQDSAGDELTSAGTICWWEKRTVTSGSNQGHFCLGPAVTRKIWAFESTINNLRVACFDSAGNLKELNATANNYDVWVHWALTFQTPNLILYRNGEIVDADAFAGTPSLRACNTEKHIGWIVGYSMHGGPMQDVRVFADCLTQSHVQAIFNGGAGTPKSLAAAMRKPLASILRQMGA